MSNMINLAVFENDRLNNYSLSCNDSEFAKTTPLLCRVVCVDSDEVLGRAYGKRDYLRRLALKLSKKGIKVRFDVSCQGYIGAKAWNNLSL